MPDLNPNPYLSDQWLEKRKIIIARDNYTCQNRDCNTFDPSSGEIQLLAENDDLQLHYYDDRNGSVYRLSSSLQNLTIEIDFGWGNWLVHPILQVHHLRYIQGKEVWDYANEDMVTLCQECHKIIHEQCKIPVYDSLGQLISTQQYGTKDDEPDIFRNHNLEPWMFKRMDIDGYVPCTELCPHLRVVILDLENEEEIRRIALQMATDFFNKYLPTYRPSLQNAP